MNIIQLNKLIGSPIHHDYFSFVGQELEEEYGIWTLDALP